jgi:hypothetical protein
MQSHFEILENAELELGAPGKRKGCLVLTYETASCRKQIAVPYNISTWTKR